MINFPEVFVVLWILILPLINKPGNLSESAVRTKKMNISLYKVLDKIKKVLDDHFLFKIF